ncbi:MAG: Hsp70 family protein [Planctomyces sp.]
MSGENRTSSSGAGISNSGISDEGRQPSRFVIGIDLGTTNSALCYVDTTGDRSDDSPMDVSRLPQTQTATRALSSGSIHVFPISQIVTAGLVEKRDGLPSFHYEPLPEECRDHAMQLPWSEDGLSYCVGVYARDHGRQISGRLVESAKSWLCHNGVDRRAALLPWHGAPDVTRLSPVDVSSRYLSHLRDAWNHQFPEHLFQDQDVVLTIPASFDEVARELTVAAARQAGLARVILIEEPQAAFYSWVHLHQADWEQRVTSGQKILVCDIGGGTSDFSLIHVRSASDGSLQFHRVAVGEHLLLGGDNLDLAIAHLVERRLVETERVPAGGLSPRQWSVLLPACRNAKEVLLSDRSVERHTIVLPGSGSKLIGSSLQVEVTREEIIPLILDGFLPEVDLSDKPTKRQSGFQEFGLPYAPDPAITKYLAAFLTSHDARPDVILFNGGFFASSVLRERLLDCINRWFSPDPGTPSPASIASAEGGISSTAFTVLQNDRLDLAVARGAAYFGMVRRGCGVRIIAGLARTYYMKVLQQDGTELALCLIEAGAEPSAEARMIERDFEILTSEPVEFPVLVSSTRLTDAPGTLIPLDPEQMTALPPIRTVLNVRKKEDERRVRVRISVRLTEIGTLELWCLQQNGDRRWQLQFDIRSAVETDRDAHSGAAERLGVLDEATVEAGTSLIRRTFTAGSKENPDGLARRISEAVGISRHQWPPSLLRAFWSELMIHEDCRRRSTQLESRWLNLAGYCLRPGFGMAADDWRVEETWKTLRGRLVFSGASSLTEWRILCRRISGGLNAARQAQLAASVISALRQKHRQLVTGKGKAPDYASSSHDAAEIWRMLGSLELLTPALRLELGQIAVELAFLPTSAAIRPALIWAAGRLGARVPVYGPINLVLPFSEIERWVQTLLETSNVTENPQAETAVHLALMQMCRRTGDRYRDCDPKMRERVTTALRQRGASEHLQTLVSEGGNLDAGEAGQIIGESLPAGLRIC